jgi:hypothetical protein
MSAVMPARSWYVMRNGKRVGPFSDGNMLRFIESGKLVATDQVWRHGLPDWIEAASVSGWFAPPERPANRTAAPPPSPPPPPEPKIESAPASAPQPVAAAPAPAAQQPAPEAKANYFIRHWRGELSLPVSYWVNGILTTMAAIFFGAAIAQVDMTRQPTLGAVVYLLFVAFIIVATLWQLVGIWRSADNHKGRGGSGFWAGFAKFAVVIGLLRTFGEMGTTILPAATEMVKIAAGDKEMASRQIRVLRNASEVEVSGTIGYGLTDELVKVLDAHPTVTTLHLNSNGGRVLEAQKLRDVIAERNLRTYTSTECASACVLAFMAGSERLLGPKGKIGLHSFSVGSNSVSTADYSAEYAFARTRHIDTSLLEKGFATSPASMWYPTAQELLNANLVTRLAGETELAFSGINVAKVTAADMEKALDQVRIYRALKDHEPEAYRTAVDATTDAVLRGNSLADARAVTMPLIQSIVQRRLPDATDEVMIRFGELVVDELTAIRERDPLLCYAYAFGGDAAATGQALDLLPPEVKARDLDVSAQIIESSATLHRPAQLTAAQTDQLFEQIGARLDARLQPAFQWLDAGTARTNAQKRAVCDLMIDLYAAVNTLPPAKAAPMLRGMFSQQ